MTTPRPFIIPAARAVLLDAEGRVLLIRRSDNKMWALPAGGIEAGESVTDCLRREVREETGLIVESEEAFAVYTEPRFKPPSGGKGQLFTVAFRVDKWSGTLVTNTNETLDARFFAVAALRALPDLMPMYLECVEDCLRFDGTFIVK